MVKSKSNKQHSVKPSSKDLEKKKSDKAKKSDKVSIKISRKSAGSNSGKPKSKQTIEKSSKSSKNNTKTSKKTKSSGKSAKAKIQSNKIETDDNQSGQCKEQQTESNGTGSRSGSRSKDEDQCHGQELGEKCEEKNVGTSDGAKTEKLEFTKPTINQMERDEEWEKKMWRFKPLSTVETIDPREFEDFNDEVNELNSGVKTLRLSYGSIIKSLVAIYSRRSKKKSKKDQNKQQQQQEPPQQKNQAKINFLTNLSDVVNSSEVEAVREKATDLEKSEMYSLERFINPITREETFQKLFDEIDMLNAKTAKFRNKFYDSQGNFLREKYDSQNEIKWRRKQLNEFWSWVRRLATVVDEIARNFNDDLLNYFRLH